MKPESVYVRRWQAKQKAKGLCTICKKPRNHYADWCDKCQKRWRPIKAKIARKSYWKNRGKNQSPEARAKRNAYAVKWREQLRDKLIKEYGGKCTCCGETIPEFLTIDHVNGDGAKERKAKPWLKSKHAMYLFLRKHGFPKDRYQLLCMNCNCAKSHNRECPHKRLIGDLPLDTPKQSWRRHST